MHQVLINGQWRAAKSSGSFAVDNPATGEKLADQFPISTWADCDEALAAAAAASVALRTFSPELISRFLKRLAERMEARAAELVSVANAESGLAKSPRLAEVELPRTTGQLRQAADAAVEGSWSHVVIDTKTNIRSYLAPVGPVCVFGPNNFPFAFNSAAGGDFASAIATGNPVIAKANTSHPNTTRLLAEEAFAAVKEVGLPPATVQLIYRTSHEDGAKLVSDHRTGATAYTGSRHAGLVLKAAADKAGKPIYLELSSVNPVLVLPGAIQERLDKVAEEFTTSCLMGAGQFCTNPGLVIFLAGEGTEKLIAAVKQRFEAATPAPLLTSAVLKSLTSAVKVLQEAGAKLITGGQPVSAAGYRFNNTLLRVDGAAFLKDPEKLQTEAFGNVSLFVVAQDAQEAIAVLGKLEGNLTGCVYSATTGADDALYDQLVPHLRPLVGRLLNDKMPTGVAVSPAMNHGGPYPATGHAGFTAVGIPASLRRFGILQCFDNLRQHRLPAGLKDKNPNGKMWRSIDGVWTRADVGQG